MNEVLDGAYDDQPLVERERDPELGVPPSSGGRNSRCCRHLTMVDRPDAGADRRGVGRPRDRGRRRRPQSLNYFDERQTNAIAEGVTNKVKVMKRRALWLPQRRPLRSKRPYSPTSVDRRGEPLPTVVRGEPT